METPAEAATNEAASIPEPVSVEKPGRDPFAKVRPELSEDEFASPAVARLMLDRIADLQAQVRDERPYRAKYHEADKERAILQEKFKTRLSSEVISGFCLAVGTLLVGLAPVLTVKPEVIATIVCWIGILLILGAIISRAIVLRK
jgi:VIT1/CCC1 family predicted Fe2+/Mn2+ transporter